MALACISRTSPVLQLLRFTKNSCKFVTETSVKNVRVFPTLQFCTNRKTPEASEKPTGPNAPMKPKVHKPMTSPQITLILPEEKVMSVTLENAERLAKRRELKLVKVLDFDTKTQRPVYKLMTKLEFFEEEAKYKERKKKDRSTAIREEKLFTISSKISENDLQSKLRQMNKLISKRHEIKVYISIDGNPTRADEIASTVQQELNELSTKNNLVKSASTLKLKFSPKIIESPDKEGETSKETEQKEAQG